MSVPGYPGAPAPDARPATVRAASYLLFAIGGITLLKAAVDLIVVNTPLSVYRDAYTGGTGSGFASIAAATFDIFLAAGVAILAIMNNHGRNGSRVTTFVLGGIFLLCGGLDSVGDLPSSGKAAGTLADRGRFAAALPSGYGILFAFLDLLIVLAVVGAVVLLALPPTNRFFRHRAALLPGLVPHPYPGAPYPGPSYPGPARAGQLFPGPAQAGVSQPFASQVGMGSPGFELRPSSEPPHTSSLPPIDPWAAPANDYEPRHQEPPTTP